MEKFLDRMLPSVFYEKDLDKHQWHTYISYQANNGDSACRVLDYVYDKWCSDLASHKHVPKTGHAYMEAYEKVYGVIHEQQHGNMY